MEPQDQTFQKFHRARVRQLALCAIEKMQSIGAGGLFENISGIKNLWDEASWAIMDGFDHDALAAAYDTIEQFASVQAHQLIPEELSLHGYVLGDETDGDGLPPPSLEIMAAGIAGEMRDLISDRNFDDFNEI